jgi:hypothetical protein
LVELFKSQSPRFGFKFRIPGFEISIQIPDAVNLRVAGHPVSDDLKGFGGRRELGRSGQRAGMGVQPKNFSGGLAEEGAEAGVFFL